MPLYTYTCSGCGFVLERWCSIAEMQEWERSEHLCCGELNILQRDYRPRRHVTFHAGIYENIGEHPMQIDTAQQLVDECRKRDNSSVYMKDMAGLFGAKENRWI